MESIDLWTIASIAFLGSFGHCIGMCGGIVIAYSSRKIDNKWSNIMQGFAHLVYSSGRITTYVMLGAIFGAIGGVAQFNGYTTAAMTIIAGIFMILAGLSLLVMLIFGLSTIPALFSLGFFTQLLSNSSLRKVMMNLASIIVILFGIYTIYRGYDFIENPEKSVLNCCEEVKDINTSGLAPFEAVE